MSDEQPPAPATPRVEVIHFTRPRRWKTTADLSPQPAPPSAVLLAHRQGDTWPELALPPVPEVFTDWGPLLVARAAPAFLLVPDAAYPSPVGVVGGRSAQLLRPWPSCASCGAPLDVAAQVDLSACTPLLNQTGFLSLFGCAACFDGEEEPRGLVAFWEPVAFARQERPGDGPNRLEPGEGRGLKAQQVHRFPPPSELDNKLHELKEKLREGTGEASLEAAYSRFAGGSPFTSHLGGYPWPLKGPMGASCPCGRPRVLLWQQRLAGGTAYLYFCGATSKCPGPAEVSLFFQRS